MKIVNIYFCPRCHNLYSKKIENESTMLQHCNKCDSYVLTVCTKQEFLAKNSEEQKQMINNLKAEHSEAALPVEVLLKRLNKINENIDQNIKIMKNIMVFYIILTIMFLMNIFSTFLSEFISFLYQLF